MEGTEDVVVSESVKVCTRYIGTDTHATLQELDMKKVLIFVCCLSSPSYVLM